jgi:hypothetical protein
MSQADVEGRAAAWPDIAGRQATAIIWLDRAF